MQTLNDAPAIELKSHFSPRDDGGLDLFFHVDNRSDIEVFLFNGLWRLDDKSHFVADEQPVYRYLGKRDRSLNHLVGIPRMPRSKTPLFQIIPHLTRLPGGGQVKLEVNLPGPLKEYNPYFPETDSSTFESVTVSEVDLRVDYLRNAEDVQTQESKILPDFLELISPSVLDRVESVTTKSAEIEIAVEKRTDEFERE